MVLRNVFVAQVCVCLHAAMLLICIDAGFTGPNCDECAPHHFGYPDCKEELQCACVHGVCDVTTGKCSCPANYHGDRCEHCVAGHSCTAVKDNQGGSWIPSIGILMAGGAVAWYIKSKKIGDAG